VLNYTPQASPLALQRSMPVQDEPVERQLELPEPALMEDISLTLILSSWNLLSFILNEL
jgi:hypothetical protein